MRARTPARIAVHSFSTAAESSSEPRRRAIFNSSASAFAAARRPRSRAALAATATHPRGRRWSGACPRPRGGPIPRAEAAGLAGAHDEAGVRQLAHPARRDAEETGKHARSNGVVHVVEPKLFFSAARHFLGAALPALERPRNKMFFGGVGAEHQPQLVPSCATYTPGSGLARRDPWSNPSVNADRPFRRPCTVVIARTRLRVHG